MINKKTVAKLDIVICIDAEGPVNYALDTWDKIYEKMRTITSDDIMGKYPDSYGKGIKLSYFILDWVGFEEDPTARTKGYNAVYDKYEKNIFPLMPEDDFGVYWHYHHPFSDGIWRNGGWNTDWNDNKEYEEQINRLVIERSYFPSVYRAGGTIETNEQSGWLEKWIPIDFSSRSPQPTYGFYLKNIKSIIKGKFNRPSWDWSVAPSDWSYYNPSREDYRRPGSMRRAIFRCLDAGSHVCSLSVKEVKKAFLTARKEGRAVLSFFTHDFYVDADKYIVRSLENIAKVSREYKDVAYEYRTALSAARDVLYPDDVPSGDLGLNIDINGDVVHVSVRKNIFSEQPWITVKYNNGEYRRIDAEKCGEMSWTFTITDGSIIKVGAGASGYEGQTEVKVKDL